MANEGYQTSQGTSQKAAQASRILARLFACFPESDTTAEAQADRFRGYLIAIETFDVATLEAVAVKIMRGRSTIDGERVNPKFMPTPPQLALLCDEQRRESFVTAKPRLIYERPLEQITDEERERRRQRVAAISDGYAKTCDRMAHETRRDWVHRMRDEGRVKMLEDDAAEEA